MAADIYLSMRRCSNLNLKALNIFFVQAKRGLRPAAEFESSLASGGCDLGTSWLHTQSQAELATVLAQDHFYSDFLSLS